MSASAINIENSRAEFCHSEMDFPRTMGVLGDVPRFPEATVATPAIDLSHEATPAADDIRNLMTICMPLQDSLIREAVMRLAKSALAKIEGAH